MSRSRRFGLNHIAVSCESVSDTSDPSAAPLQPADETLSTTAEAAREVSLLAVAHAAIDPRRRAHQADIMVESVLRVLAARGQAMTIGDVVTGVGQIWRTKTITEPLVHQALESAKGAQLATTQDVLFGDPVWVLTDSALRDLNEDAAWAQAVLDRFDREAAAIIEDDPNRSLLKSERIPALIGRVRAALAVGAEGLYGLTPSASPGAVKALKFNETNAVRALADVEPKASRQAAERLLLTAINPDEPFGDEYLDLVVAGNVLHGMLTRRDVTSPPSLAGLRLVFDTSVIVDLAHPGSEQARAVKAGIGLARSLGAEVVVAEHTLAEWARLFDGAEQERRGFNDDADGLGALGVLLQNPFLRAYSLMREADDHLTWGRYAALWRDPRKQLEACEVNVRPHGNNTDEDRAIATRMTYELRRLNRIRGDSGRPGRLRAAEAIEADSQTAAMVARWRSRGGVDAGFFVARDRMIAEAYRAVVPSDSVSLVVTLPAWIALAAALTTEDPMQRSEVAKIIGNAALRDSFLALAASYTYEEVSSFAAALREDDAPAPEDVVDFVQTTLDGFEDAAQPLRLAEIKLRGSEVLQARALRRNQRARRATQMVDRTVANEKAKIEAEKVLALAEADVRTRSALALKDQSLATKDTELARAETDAGRLQRRVTVLVRSFVAFLVLAGGMIGMVLLWRAGTLDRGRRKGTAILGMALASVAAVQFVRSQKLSTWAGWLAGSFFVPILVNLLTR